VQLPVFVTSQDFKTSIRFTMDGDSSDKIFPAAIVRPDKIFPAAIVSLRVLDILISTAP
jgi:hypothetical protein